MERVIFSVVFCLMLLFTIGVTAAQEVPSYQDKYVNDFANVLSVSQAEGLRSLFSSVDTETTAEIVFVSMDTINGEDIGQYSLAIADSWKVGKADKDNGLVILYVKDIGKIWVSTGYGLEGILPDSKVGRLLDENYVPLRDSGNVSEGIVLFGNAIAQVIYDNKEEVLSGQAGGSGNAPSRDYSFWFYFVWFIVFVVGELMYKILAPSKSWWLGGVLGGIICLVIGFFFSSSILGVVILVLLGVGFGLLFDYLISRKYSPGKTKSSSNFWWIPVFLPSSGGSHSGGGFGGGGFGGGGAGR